MWNNSNKMSVAEWSQRRENLITHYAHFSNDDLNRRDLIKNWAIGIASLPFLSQFSFINASVRETFYRDPLLIAFDLAVLTLSCLTGMGIGGLRKEGERIKSLQALAVKLADSKTLNDDRPSLVLSAHELIQHIGLGLNPGTTEAIQNEYSEMANRNLTDDQRRAMGEKIYEKLQSIGPFAKLPEHRMPPISGCGHQL